MPSWRDIVHVTLHALWWPLGRMFAAIVFLIWCLLAPVWALASFILLPVVHLAHTVFTIITYPFSVQWLERIETIYIYLGTAALVGCLTGAIIFAMFRFLSSTLNIDTASVPRTQDRVRSTAEFRAARREKKEETVDEYPPAPTPPVVLKKIPGSRRKGLLSQAIVEEEDSDF